MNVETQTVDFGAPNQFGAHVFRVEISASKAQPVRVLEDHGFRGSDRGLAQPEERALLPRGIWAGISEAARREFNGRLKAQRITAGRWKVGSNLIDRLLGKELCVLAWAAEVATQAQLPIICSRWAALRPEERWWLFSMTVAEAGLSEDTQRGWRRALHAALSDGESLKSRKRNRPAKENDSALPLLFSHP